VRSTSGFGRAIVANPIAAIVLIYLAGYIVATTIGVRNWFDHFGAEFSGVAWAMFMAVAWPLIAPPYLVWLVVRSLSNA
jgi:hypothetical protein